MNTPKLKQLIARALRIEPEVRTVTRSFTDTFVLQITWRGVITHRYLCRGIAVGIEFTDEVNGQSYAITGHESVFTLVLPDEIMRAGHLPPLSDDHVADADPWRLR